MKILLVHTRYRGRGGEDSALAEEQTLLEHKAHAVRLLEFDNSVADTYRSAVRPFRLATETVWSVSSHRRVAEAVASFGPDIVHVHNTFAVGSPSIYSAARLGGAAVVQTAHNYRLLCPSAVLYRDGEVCEDCVGRRVPWPGLVHRCYKSSIAQSATLVACAAVNNLRGTWRNEVDQFIVLTNLARREFIKAAYPPEQLSVKPNFVDLRAPISQHRAGAIYVGRLDESKGVATLLAAWKQGPAAQLTVAGDGPCYSDIISASAADNSIHFFGKIDRAAVLAAMQRHAYLIFPSQWFEGFPMTILEAYASGLPVIASNIGAMTEIIKNGETGLLFEPGNPADLANKIRWAEEHAEAMRDMGRNARSEYEAKYTPERNYEILMEIYAKAMERRNEDAHGVRW